MLFISKKNDKIFLSGGAISIELLSDANRIIFSDNVNNTNPLDIFGFGQIYANGSWTAYIA